jgi:urease accessory protein
VIRIESFAPEGGEPSTLGATLTLPFALRRKSRLLARLDDGEEAGLFLPRGTVLRDGDRLVATDGRIVAVRAAIEDLHRARPTAVCPLARIAYHLGNRHVPVEIGADDVRLERDAVLCDMLTQLGAIVDEIRAPFDPEAGAYGGGHRHGGAASHDDEYALAQSVFAVRHGAMR